MDAPPPQRVLTAFGVERRPHPLLGGQRPVWRAGDVVFKPLDGPAAGIAWERAVLTRAASQGVRLAPPLPSRDGRLVVGGWTAYPWLAGTTTTTRWQDVFGAGERLHALLADEPRPAALLDGRTDLWARADRIAWGEVVVDATDEPVAALLAAREPVTLPAQLVHGDLGGNVLTEPRRPPAVLDLSPYWRPADWALAVAAVDLATWHGAGDAPIDAVATRPDGVQLLVRAALFRLLSAHRRERLAVTADAILARLA